MLNTIRHIAPSKRRGVRTLAGLSGGVTAVGTSRLLDVEGALSCKSQTATGQPISIFFPNISQLLPVSSMIRESAGVRRSSLSDYTDHNVGTGCASCCDAYRSWRYPSLLSLLVMRPTKRLIAIAGRIGFAHTHFDLRNCKRQHQYVS